MKNKKIQNIALSAMFLSLCLVLPFLTGQIKEIGNMLLPIHFPVMLCGLICGPQYGLLVGLIAPIMRSMLFSMPMLYPTAIAMAFELGTYGFVIGFIFSKSKWHCIKSLYKSMIIAMISGRLIWGIAQVILLGIQSKGFTLTAFITASILNAIPGIILQLVLIPTIMLLLKKTHFSHKKKSE